MAVINLNSHPIRVERKDGSIHQYPPDGRVFRLEMVDKVIAQIDDNPIVSRVYYEPEEGLIPPAENGTWYIVPSQVTQIIRRPDFISPDTRASNGAKRDPRGQVLSVTRFRTYDSLSAKSR